jgi:ribonucleoside-diphosphate reductase alpha chain
MTALEYFNGDELAASVWQGKYALKNKQGEYMELNPSDMHGRMAKEFARIESKYAKDISKKELQLLSKFGQDFQVFDAWSEDEIFSYFDRFKYIIPQGSIMSMLGNPYAIGSLSNCFVVPPPFDSYAGIMQTDQHLAQLMKRRGGVGTNLNTLRPEHSHVSNAAGTSTGAVSFMDRYSNTTREVAQNGRRGALMLLMSCLHPEIFSFVKIKGDRTKVTGANISVMLTDKFMKAAEKNEDFICQFPIDREINSITRKWILTTDSIEYNKLANITDPYGDFQVMKIHARELYNLIIENAWENAEPGVAFIDRIQEYCPEGVYDIYVPIASNPCAEQWMQAYDACRLLALNLFSIVKNPFTNEAEIDKEKLYEIAYIQQRLADNIVDLEIEYVQRIIEKIEADPEPEEVKAIELELWRNIKATATASRRTGCGFTALGDMLAALGLKYDSDEALEVIKEVSKIKMRAELDCTVDLAILRGTFEGWNPDTEFDINRLNSGDIDFVGGNNDFYEMLIEDFYTESMRMIQYGRRNLSWSNIAPCGSISILTQTTSGLEPLFYAFYMRKKKVNPSDAGVRVDFVDQNGDSWTEYPVIHPKFKMWIESGLKGVIAENLTKDQLEQNFVLSPWYKSTANDIDWIQRIRIQSVLQRYTTNAISSTINLPNTVSKEEVSNIYMEAWRQGLKGVTVYRDGCRTGVLTTDTKPKVETDKFGYLDAVKRPKELDGCLHLVTVKGERYGVIVGLLDDNPYEVFAFRANSQLVACCGKIIKVKRGQYAFLSEQVALDHLETATVNADEQVLSRFTSALLRHRASPTYICEQIDKTPLEVVSFGKALKRVLIKYQKQEGLNRKETCPNCGEDSLIREEGCKRCLSCGHSECG